MSLPKGRNIIKDSILKQGHKNYQHIWEIESLIQRTKNSLYNDPKDGQLISTKLYEKMHALYLYI
jgi:hypothetical protein